MVAQTNLPIADEKQARALLKFIEELEDLEDVQDVYANDHIDDKIMAAIEAE